MAYNPYKAIKGIYDAKVAYHTNQSLGRDPAQFHQQALPYYQELAKNGYEGLAAQLDSYDAVQTGELLKQYKPDEQFNVDDAFNIMTGGGSASTVTGQTNGSNKSVYSGIDPTANDSVIDNFVNQIQNGTGMMNDTYQTAQGIATGAIQTQPSAATQGLLNAYNDSNNRLNGAIQYDQNGNVISGLNTEHYNIGRNQLDYLNNFDVTKQPYYQGIMDAYKLGGYNAAQGAYANGAADNGGNIDSYAAANANRQQLAFTTAGMQQAMAMANQNQQNWQNLYSQMSQDLDNQGQLSLATLEQARLMYAADAEERMNALDNAGSLAKADLEAKIRAYEQAVKERMEDKRITSDEAMQEADLAEQRARLEMEIARDLEQSNIEADWRKYMSDNDLQGTMYTSDNDLRGTMYKADADVASTGIRANADMYSADRSAEASMYGSQQSAAASMYSALQNADATRYKADQDYAAKKYEADTGLTKQQLDSLDAYQLQELISQTELEKARIQYGNNGGDTGYNNVLSYDDALSLAAYLFREGTPQELNDYGLSGVGNKQQLTDWFESYGLTRSDAAKATKAIMDADTGYPNGLEDIQRILKDYNSTTPVYYTTPVRQSVAMQ